MTALSRQHCKPVAPDKEPISELQITDYLKELGLLWEHNNTTQTISRRFRFKDYFETMAFINATAWIFHQQDHHPDILVSYNHCTITFTTHSINNLSLNDFICAARINEITPS